jgi:uncharacterized phage protein (TIGR02220 family)
MDLMAVIRVNKTADYTVMSNSHFKEREMSLKAKGLLSMMLSLPDDWDYSINGLATLSKDGKDSVMNALSELEQFGYLKRTKIIDEKGRFGGYAYDIYENPQTGKPYPGKPNTGKPPQLNTKQSSTKKLSTDDIKYIIEYLNKKAGTKYRSTSKDTIKHINARAADGFKVEDFIKVIDNQYAKWKGTEWEQYIRPSTLFGTKFENYLNAKVAPERNDTNGSTTGDTKKARVGHYI